MQETKLKLLERIVDRRQDSLYRFAYFRTGSQADAEDIVQDVLLRLFHSDCNLDRIDDDDLADVIPLPVFDARKEAEEKVRAEYLPKLQEANLRAAAATVLSDDKLDSWLKTVNVSAFVDEQGTVNTDEVMGTLTALFGDSDARGGDRRKNGGHPDWGHSRTNGGGVHSGVEAGRELYKSRYNK